jgi:hypothetical protein
MKQPTFYQPQDLWEQDGSVRDVYLRDASESDWLVLFGIATGYPHQYSFDGKALALPRTLSMFSNREGSHLLTITVGSACLNCHFFDQGEIELNIDPRDVVDELTHKEVLSFLELLSNKTQKELWLTAENMPTSPYLSYKPTSSAWTVHDPQFPHNDV